MRRLLAAVLFFCFAVLPAHADLRASVNALGQVKLDGLEAAIKTLAADPAPAVPAILDAWAKAISMCASPTRKSSSRFPAAADLFSPIP